MKPDGSRVPKNKRLSAARPILHFQLMQRLGQIISFLVYIFVCIYIMNALMMFKLQVSIDNEKSRLGHSILVKLHKYLHLHQHYSLR